MGTLTENPVWEAGVRHFEANAVLTGGPDCPDNLPLTDLANRTAWLKQQVEAAQGGLAGHEAAADPHPQYLTSAEGDAKVAAHVAAADPHPVYWNNVRGDAKIAAAIAALVNSSPATLDTLAELATALGNDPNFATTITNSLASKASQAGVQSQTYTAFTTTGATGAFAIAPNPAISAYAAGQRFRVKFHAAGNGADVLNVSTLGNKSLKQYDSTGAKVAATIAANQLTDIEYDGVDMVILDPLPNGSLVGLKNRLINGCFTVNQRAYVSGTNTVAANQYTLDRWRVVTSGQNITWAASGNGNIVTVPAGGIEQVIEGVNLEAGTYCLSWVGTATGYINGTAVANGGTVVLPANANSTVKFAAGTVSFAQLERALSPSSFDVRPIGLELVLCQRYYEQGGARWMVLYGSGTTNGNTFGYYAHHVLFKVKKRATPTATNTAPAANPYSVYVGKFADTDGVLLNNSGAYLSQTPTSQNAFSCNWTADAEL